MKNPIKYACYITNIATAIIANLPPLMLLTFRTLYGISYTQLGFLVAINFITQLSAEMVLIFASHRISMHKALRLMPGLAFVGIVAYSLLPLLFPQAVYPCLLLGTVLFAVPGGLAEVLINPVIEALPSAHPDKELSKLHSVYAWGAVVVIVFSTLFLLVFGQEKWHLLCLLLSIIPLVSFVLFLVSEIPPLSTPEKAVGIKEILSHKTMLLCILLIFFGGAAECTMAQWSSGYLEKTFSIPKIYGDILGVAMFSVTLGLGRSLYAKKGKKIYRVLTAGAISAAVCYGVVAATNTPAVGLAACIVTGFCTSMLWPGSLIVAGEKAAHHGVVMYALMAAGGDLGASVGPQVVGTLADMVAAAGITLGGCTPEQTGLKVGMMVSALFPLLLLPLIGILKKDVKGIDK